MGLNLRKYSGSFLAIVLFQLILVSAVWANPQKVYFAGFAFLSDYADIGHQYPYSKIISEVSSLSKDRSKIEAVLSKKVKKLSNPNLEIVIDELGDHQSADALSLALVVDWEDVCIENLSGGLYKIVLNLHGQILVFDFNSKKISASYPFGVRVNDSSRTEPGKDHIRNLFRRLYFENIGDLNFLDEFINTLQNINLKEIDEHHLKVTEVVLGEKSFNSMPDKIKTNQASYKKFVAQQFSSFLAANQSVSVLPYTAGHAIQGKMALRFENGSALELEIPDVGIPIKITVRGFKKVKLDENHTGASWAYGSFIKLTVLDHWGAPVIDTKFKNAAVKIIPVRTEITCESDWSAYEESLLKLFQDLTQQITKRSSTWISERTKDKNAESQLKNFDKLLRNNRS
jgi:hypothetical protein